MAVRYVFDIRITREPAECTPGRDPGWYVQDRDKIVAYADTLEEARAVAEAFYLLPERAGIKESDEENP